MILSTLLPASIGNGDDRFTLPYRLAHRAEKGPRFSALNDALFPKGEHRMDPESGIRFWVRCAHRAEKWTRFSARRTMRCSRKRASDAAARPDSATGPSGAVRLLPAAVRPMSTAAAAPATLQRRPGRRRWTARSPLPRAMRTPRHTCGARACPGSARRRAKNALSARRKPANAEQPS
jgi:hypothetical protein